MTPEVAVAGAMSRARALDEAEQVLRDRGMVEAADLMRALRNGWVGDGSQPADVLVPASSSRLNPRAEAPRAESAE